MAETTIVDNGVIIEYMDETTNSRYVEKHTTARTTGEFRQKENIPQTSTISIRFSNSNTNVLEDADGSTPISEGDTVTVVSGNKIGGATKATRGKHLKMIRLLLLPISIPFSWIFGFIIYIRNTLFNLNIIKTYKFDKPIISVGNITTGGTGKTPLVIYLAQLLRKNGIKPGIVSRGYKRKSSGLQVVHNGEKIVCKIEKSGDEPFLIAKTLINVPVLVSENRKIGIDQLINYYGVDIIIMDDGFQNRKINRDLDIVTISAKDSLKYYRVLPWGNLREPLYNISRANCVIYTKTDDYQLPPIDSIICPLISSSKFLSIITPTLMRYTETSYKKINRPPNSCFAFCGVADSQSFIKIAKNLSITICNNRFYADHQNYTKSILKELSLQIKLSGTKNILTTEKDLYKLPQWFYKEVNIYVIKIMLEFEKESELHNKIKLLLNR